MEYEAANQISIPTFYFGETLVNRYICKMLMSCCSHPSVRVS